MFLLLSIGDEPDASLSTPFEQWCESMDMHPEDPRSWPLYQASVGAADHAPAAS